MISTQFNGKKMIKKVIFITLFLTLLPSLGASENLNFDQLEGCYKTIEVNGKKVPMGDIRERSLSRIEIIANSVFRDLERQELTSPLITIFTGQDGFWYSYQSFVPFLELGEVQSTPTQLFYTIDERVLLGEWGRYKEVDHFLKLSFQTLEDGELRGEAYFSSDARDMQSESSFILEETSCH